MSERENPADEFERAPKIPETDEAPTEVFSEQADRQELATAYSRRSRRAGGPPSDGDAAQSLTNDEPSADARRSEFRLRDFRPEASAPVAPIFGTPPTPKQPEPTRGIPTWTPPAADDDGQLSYKTQAVPMVARPENPPRAVINSVPAEFAAPPRPMTRRELRELEVRQGIRPQADDAPAEVSVPVVASAPAPAAPPVVASAPAPAAPPLVAPDEPAELILPPVVQLAPPIPVPAPTALVRPAAAAAPVAPPVASPEPVVFTDASGAAPSNRPPAPTPVSRGIDSAPEIFTAPHPQWSTQPDAETASKPGDSFFRTVGTSTGALTTNALVIPSLPQASDITRPFSGTGEILVTGSIDLPMSLGSIGANSARFDHSDIDALFAQEDHDYTPTDAAPVRAIRAVSTHTSTHGVISAKKPASNRLPMMMAVTAGVLAVGVAALFAAGMIFGYF